MSTLGSWIDAETVSGLGKQLATPVSGVFTGPPAGPLPLTRLSAEDFRLPEHYPPAAFPAPENDERGRVREVLRNIRRKAEDSGLLAKPGTPPVVPPDFSTPVEPVLAPVPVPAPAASQPLSRGVTYFTPPVGPLATRIRAFIDWLRRQVTCQELFIVDQQGNPASDREATPELVTAAVLMAEAGRRALKYLPSAPDGAVHLDLPEERKLCVIDTITNAGPFFLGLVLPEALGARAADRLRRALRRTIETEPASVVVQQRGERR